MRSMSLLLLAATLAGCSTAPPPFSRTARAEAQFQQLLAGKVAGPPVACLSGHRSNDMVVIDDNTILFRDGSRRVYLNQPIGGCPRLGSGQFALITRNIGGQGLCRGDIAQVMDVQNGFSTGSCVIGDFVPYIRPQG